MALPTLHYLSHFEPSGYGLSAIAMVRALRNAGYPVRWTPLKRVGYDQVAVMSWPQALTEASHWLRDDESLSDLPALAVVAAVVPLAGAAGFTIAHVAPELLAAVFATAAAESAHFERVAYTTWESDALPVHWLRCFDLCHRLVVPSRFNQAVFAGDLRRPVQVVPHVRRHRTNEFSAPDLVELRSTLDIAPDEFIFYSINQFEPRKNYRALIAAFVQAFSSADKVVLVIKTGSIGWADGPFFEPVQVRQHLQQMLLRMRREIKSDLPKICLIDAANLGGRRMDALHAMGDCYVSLTHGEGFGMGACEAACAGNPVLMTGWGGQLDFLGGDYPGNLPYTLEAAPVWPPERPSFWPSQRWAACSIDGAVQAMQGVVASPDEFRRLALERAESIHMQLSEPSVAAAWATVFAAS
ncbi:MAG: glycosyltransferase [Rhizobacter sp.]|nr:glycosyltransferase [Burkholderiales bacterium]